MPTETLIHPDIKKVLLSEEVLRARILELCAQLTKDYAGRKLMVVGVLKGSLIFMADLLRAFEITDVYDADLDKDEILKDAAE